MVCFLKFFEKEYAMKTKTILMCSFILALGACGSKNKTHDSSSMRYTSGTEVTQSSQYREQAILSSYTILFDHDDANIRDNEIATLNRVLREMDKYKPRQVTVTGYTDSSGTEEYNQSLSRQREQAVSRVLTENGVSTQMLDRKAVGQYEQAIRTNDGVQNQSNRRVVIDFRR